MSALTPDQTDVLWYLHEHPGASIDLIAAALRMSPRGMGQRLHVLTRRGLLVADAGGWTLTDEGRAA